ncbi:GNAT family N-acetyltransferase [Lutimaribacter sp. EGI FJ00015]|uniref:GNAT family N-acetyltransferase n=1 Tax=Lutimaribacter degradans TaxID=2945989 RepID=A0ACC5ZY23_9RHOB|nr:GNAT family N-acyltransferase [Lutimaribacter sp. EGI FJ00013]MCM2562244.1 GNAT family N-acetyltransferase [Lutimaribacter sp. EGI FJ00013]MCO0613399.1 GNAT family N-acetyltransferase [Lutimaribacter sp. EGI FJ00015]MCO0636373.1 GNAT family N-acetyltransferase [Lutimaribacter sp. EGI FJ00014]
MSLMHAPQFSVRLANSADDLRAAQRLRYDVFVEELGGGGTMVDHDARLEQDRFDPFFDHLLLLDKARPEGSSVVGVYRLLRDDQAAALGQFYSEDEYDLSVLKSSGRRLLELGRSCLHRDYRGGLGMFHLWSSLAAYVDEHGTDVLFGVASFHGTDPAALAAPLSLLHHGHLAPPELRVRARAQHYAEMNRIAPDALDRRAAVLEIPSLIKAYLRLGGFVGEGAWVDHAFNTTDVCLILDTARMSARQRAIYARKTLA